MISMRKRVVRVALFAFAVIALYNGLTLLMGYSELPGLVSMLITRYPSKETLANLSLTEEQCRVTFPGLTKEIDGAAVRGPFKVEKEPDDYQGLVQAKIKDGKLYILSAEKSPARHMLFERNAVLHQVHRAIVTSPTPLPDTVFTYSIIDNPRQNTWSFSRDPKMKGNYWIMPHFSFWSWPLPFIGTLDEALTKITQVEKEIPWENKIDKVVWRGTVWFNSISNTALRPHLLAATKGKDWADVASLEWESNSEGAKNSIRIEDFCKYKYIIYTEGITYSGRLPFHQACKSIILTPPPSYLMHTTHFMRPLFSSSLPFSPSANSKIGINPNPRWPQAYNPSQANIIFVDPDWADLEQTVMWLRAHPSVAEGIAERQRRMVADAGYLSPAAEACYWRSLIRGWSSVAVLDEEMWKKWELENPERKEGVRWETFSLAAKSGWE